MNGNDCVAGGADGVEWRLAVPVVEVLYVQHDCRIVISDLTQPLLFRLSIVVLSVLSHSTAHAIPLSPLLASRCLSRLLLEPSTALTRFHAVSYQCSAVDEHIACAV